MPILEGEKITKNFGGLAALLDVDFNVNESEIVGLIGPNGAGKTTLFNIISGALPLKSGTIRFKGKTINGLSPNAICKRGIARTFQLIKIFGHMTVYENVLMGALFGTSGKLSSKEAGTRTGELLEFMDLASYSNYIAKDLTFVNQKKVEVARALATHPDLLMLDEFMAGLNQTEVMQGVDLVKRIRDRGITILMIEHVMTAIMSVCSRVIVLHHGEKIAEGTPSEIANNKSVIEVYFGE
ncbi:MAG: ABC transporter ATP-binding protein [Chloroflexi bacterium RBG_16_48_7]|nr:MAG: ABC transporter ATP-binding protein [Chloroflexi bacterium RBG_16_48_7]